MNVTEQFENYSAENLADYQLSDEFECQTDSECEYEYDCESDTDSDDIDHVCVDHMKKDLAEWALEYNIKHSAVDNLLKRLHNYHPELPLTARTLLHTDIKRVDLKQIAGGSCIYFGIITGFRSSMPDIFNQNANVIYYQVNIDGLPLCKSSSKSLWPILGRITNGGMPFLIGAFCGKVKPGNVTDYLHDFIQEATQLQQGFVIDGKPYTAQISCFICDAPARSLLKQIKPHTAYYGCERCVTKGVYQERRITYPFENVAKRTDVDFHNMAYEDTHQLRDTISPLANLNIGLVSSFVLDYMHLVCIGVVKRLLKTWMSGKIDIRISSACSATISQQLESLRKHIPVEFARKPRSLQEMERWKATEFRQFLVYTGCVALKSNIRLDLYENFLCLMVSVFVLLSPTLCSTWNRYAAQLLTVFVQQCEQLYGPEFVVYNVHSLLHIPDDVQKFGALDTISAFPFESFLGHIRKVIRKSDDVLQQLSRRLSEGYFRSRPSAVSVKNNTVTKPHALGPLLPDILSFEQYSVLNTTRFTVKVKDGDNCVMLQCGKIAKVVNILRKDENIFVLVQKFLNYEPFFLKPLDSTKIGIFIVGNLSKDLHIYEITTISQKYVLLPYKDSLCVATPLLHTGANVNV